MAGMMKRLQTHVTAKNGKTMIYDHDIGGVPDGADHHSVLAEHIQEVNMFPGAKSVVITDPEPGKFRPNGVSEAVKATPKRTPMPVVKRVEKSAEPTPVPILQRASMPLQSSPESDPTRAEEPAPTIEQTAQEVEEAGGEVDPPAAS